MPDQNSKTELCHSLTNMFSSIINNSKPSEDSDSDESNI